MMRKISRKSQPTALKHLTKNKTEATSQKDIADTLAEIFSANSSNSNSHFLTFKNNAEKQKLSFTSNNSEKYNQPFTPAELQEAIEASHNTSNRPRLNSLSISKTSTTKFTWLPSDNIQWYLDKQ